MSLNPRKRSAERISLPSLKLPTSPPEVDHSQDNGWEDIEDIQEVEAEKSILEGSRISIQSPAQDSPEVEKVPRPRYASSKASKRTGSLRPSRRQIARDPPLRSTHRSRTYREPQDDETDREGVRYKPRTTFDAWSKCNKVLKDHDLPMVAGWKEDIDTLLVFKAGLFSAVLTAFVVESYTFLQPDPSGTSTNLLRDILAELRNRSSQQSSPNTSGNFPFISPVPPSFAIRVNVMWFCSLVFSLSAASVGILVKQWLRDYTSHTGTSSRESARIRQFRHNGLVKWHVPEIIAALPLLLQYALGMFFIGLVDLLWSLNFVVASIVTAFASMSLLFLVVTTVLPAFWADSPHRSPQALAFYLAYKASTRIMVWSMVKVIGPLGLDRRPWPLYAPEALFQGRWRRFKSWLVKLLHERKHDNWRQREKHLVQTQDVSNLDHLILVGADALFMDDEILESVIKPCIEETEPPAAANCLIDILTHRAHGMIDDLPSWKPSGSLEPGVSTLLRLTVDILRRSIPSANEERLMKMLRMLDQLCRATPFELDHPETKEMYEQVYELLSTLLSFNVDIVSRSAFHLLYTLFPRANAAVRINAIVIENIISFARASKENDNGEAYFSACVMALQFGAELSRQELRASRDHLQRLLQELEQYITATHALPSPSLRAALYDFSERDANLVRPELIRVLNQFTGAGGDPGAHASDDRALRNLRRLYSARRPVRQSAFLPVNRLEQLGLSLPELTEQGTPQGENGVDPVTEQKF